MVKLALDKGISKAQICRDLDTSKISLYRIIGDLKVKAMAQEGRAGKCRELKNL